MINLDELEKGLVCLVPKASAVTENSTLLTCHEYSVCDCTVLRLIADLRKCREALRKSILWGECISARVPNPREDINWRYLEEARRCLSELRGLGGGG